MRVGQDFILRGAFSPAVERQLRTGAQLKKLPHTGSVSI